MTYSVNRIIANDRSLAAAAALTASTQRPSTDLRLLAQARQGHGAVTLTGPYTGAADTTVEIEVLSGAGGELRPSAPVIAGVGSGTLTVLSVDAGAVPETITLRLVTAGKAATHAELPFFGATLRARTAGAAGNLIEMEVERRLVLTETQWATLAAISAGTSELEGQQWDWGAVPSADEQIPREAPRVAFAGGAQVHRHWREWIEGRWVYRIDPAPLAEVAADTRVLSVTGDYRLTLSDGAETETYDAVTVYDALRQIAARSNLVEVTGVVADDRAPGGMGVTDIPLRTDAYALPVEAKLQGPYGVPRLDAVTVAPDAPTETITIERLPSGAWTVAGSVSGDLAAARTGIPYSDGPVGFTIPAAKVPPGEQAAISGAIAFASRNEGEELPSVCVHTKIGAAAVAKTITYTYTRRPTTSCECRSLPVPAISDYCLGLAGEEDLMSLPAAVADRVRAVYAWREGFVRDNTGYAGAVASSYVGSTVIPGAEAGYVVSGSDRGLYQTLSFDVVEVFATAEEANATAALISGTGRTYSGPTTLLNGTRFAVMGVPCMATNVVEFAVIGGTIDVGASSRYRDAEPASGRPGTLVPGKAARFGAAQSELDWAESIIEILMPCLHQVYETQAALDAWDVLWAEIQADLARMRASTGIDVEADAGYLKRYTSTCDNIRITAGIYPTFDLASSGAGACWQDDPEASHWWVDDSGAYLPAFTGRGYTSARRDGAAVVPTREFGFAVVVDCESLLKEGDAVTITVRGASTDGYMAGDQYRLPLVAAAPAPFGGGAPGDDTHTWAIRGAVSGAWADWPWRPSAPADYAAGLVGLRLTAGGIPYAVGDQWTLALEGGELRWRRDGGAWTTADLYGPAPDLGDGLALAVLGGAAPSFVAGDTWTWSALATYGPERLRSPREGRGWSWTGPDAVLDLDLGSVQPVAAVLLALHTLPPEAGVLIEGGDAAPGEWSLSPARRAGPILAVASDGATARYLRVTLSDCGPGASIGWLWAGVPWAPTAGVSALEHVRQYGLTRTGGRNPGAVYRGRGTGGRWAWSLDAGAALLPDDVSGLTALIDHVAAEGLEPVCLVPDIRDPASATLAQIDAEEVRLTEHLGYLHAGQPLSSAELPFRGLLS